LEAVTFDQFGPPDVLMVSEMPDPTAGPDELVVRVAASAINPTDLMMRSGLQAALMTGLEPPFIAGMDLAGHVHSAGPNVVLRRGAPVIGVVNPRRPEGVAHAQLVRVPAASVAQVSETLDLIAAATVPMNALTAWLALDMAGLQKGQSVLVTGATGMFGGLAVQLAKLRGLTTVAAGRDGDRAFLSGVGVDVILPREGDLAASVRSHFAEGVDALVDGALVGQEIAAAVRDGGTAISLRKSHPIEDPRLDVGYVSVLAGMENSPIIRQIAALMDLGYLTARVAEGGQFSFHDAVAAHRMAERGLRGRVVMTFA
jgi:NADPH2:quinone reductase